MIRLLTISSLFVMMAAFAQAQTSYTYKALKAYQNENNSLARAYADSAINTVKENRDPQTWRIRGYIYFEAYKIESGSEKDNHRLTSEEAFRRSLQLDTAKTYEESVLKGLYNIAVSYYNDAVKSMNDKSYMNATPSYQKYRELVKISKPETNMVGKDIEFYNALGSLLQTIYKNNKKTKSNLWQESLSAYMKTYYLDSNNRSANYHIAILYYNRGVDLILGLAPDASLDNIFETQDKTVELFLKSRPFMLRAYYLDPKNEDVLQGLKGIYYELNDKQQIEFWDKKLKELKGSENE